jgi:hypothetical protein
MVVEIAKCDIDIHVRRDVQLERHLHPASIYPCLHVFVRIEKGSLLNQSSGHA